MTTSNHGQAPDDGMDPPVLAVLEGLPKCAGILRAWAEKIEKRHEQFHALGTDLGALFAHTQQLSSELDKSRPNAPVYKNAEAALKKAIARTAKVLKDMQVSLEAMQIDLMPPSQYGSLFDAAAQSLPDCMDYVDAYREGCKTFEASGTVAPA
jgi:hypothetical protein